MRAPSHPPRPHLPTALRSLNRRASSSLQWDPPTLIPCSPPPPTTAPHTPPPASPRSRSHKGHPAQAQTHRREYRHPDPSFLRPVRHSCARSVIPAPRSVIPAPPSVIPAAPSVIPAPGPSFLRPVRHSCAGRNPCDHHRINHARTFRRPSDSSIAALPPRCSGTRRPSSPAPPDGGAAAACPCAGRGLRGGSTINTSAPIPANSRPAYAPAGVSEISITQRPSSAGADTPPRIPPPRSVIPAPGPSFPRPVRHSCAGRNPCDHHRINHARTFRRPSDPSIGALPPRCSGTPSPPPKRHTPSHLTTSQPLGLMPPTE